MPRYTIEYLEDDEVLKSEVITADHDLAAQEEAKKAFTIVQANLGARDYTVRDQHGAVLMRHNGPDQNDEFRRNVR